ncbi:MAG: metallophosphoesterase [Chlorobiales bacterium]|nr:metallophosphoesterase [Chlorobiales bacterium]
MNTRIIVSVIVSLVLNIALGYYLYRKVGRLIDKLGLSGTKPLKRIALASVVLLMGLLPASVAFRQFVDPAGTLPITNALTYASSLSVIWLIGLIVVFVPVDVLYKLVQTATGLVRRLSAKPSKADAGQVQPDQKSASELDYDLSRRKFVISSTMAGFAVPSVITAYSLFNNRTDFVINEMTLDFPNLPGELRGLKIAQVSDIHSGIFMSGRKMQEITESVNSFSPNLVALTGDFVSSAKSEIVPFVNAFQNLKSTFGTFSCLGNHDEWVGNDVVSAALKEKNLGLLRNESRVLNVDGAKLNVIGMDYTSRNIDFLDSAKKSADREGFNLLLCHHPDFFSFAKEKNIDLMLAGHTHGGQITFGLAGMEFFPIDLFYKYPRGLYQEGKNGSQKLYVNLGVGFTGTPIRTVKPEIALITLR